MNTMRLKPALHYHLDYMARASLSTLGIVSAIVFVLSLFVSVTTVDDGTDITIAFLGNVNIGGNVIFNAGSVIVIMLFVVGIAGIREDIKFLLQHGMGRYTVYFSTLWSSLISSAALGLSCEILNLIWNAWPAFPASGIVFPNGGFFSGWILHTLCFFLAWQLGMLLSLIYYRLSRTGQIVFSVAGVAFLVFALPNIILSILGDEVGVLDAIFFNYPQNPLTLMMVALLGGVLSAGGNFLLIRRAQIRE